MHLVEVHKEATTYLKKLNSPQAGDPKVMLDLKHNFDLFCEAIVLMHVNPRLSPARLSSILDYDFLDGDRMDVVVNFYLRHELHRADRGKHGAEILSHRQLNRRRWHESMNYNDDRMISDQSRRNMVKSTDLYRRDQEKDKKR